MRREQKGQEGIVEAMQSVYDESKERGIVGSFDDSRKDSPPLPESRIRPKSTPLPIPRSLCSAFAFCSSVQAAFQVQKPSLSCLGGTRDLGLQCSTPNRKLVMFSFSTGATRSHAVVNWISSSRHSYDLCYSRSSPYVANRSIFDKTFTCGISNCIIALKASRTTETNLDASVM